MNIHQSMYDFMLGCQDHTRGRAIVYGKKSVSFDNFLKEVDKVAGSLAASGIRAGDCVAVCLPNIPQSIVLFYALNRLGAVASMVHPKTNEKEFEKQLVNTKPKMAVLCEVNLFKFKPMLKGVKIVFCSMFLGGYVGLKKPTIYEPFKSDGENVAVYMHSGGTTGASKTAVLTNKCFNSLVDNLTISLNHPFSETDAMLAALPMFHGFGLAVGMHLAASTRMASALVPIFNATKTIKFMERQNVTQITVIPRMLQKILENPLFHGDVVQQLRNVYVGGDNLDEKLRVAFNERLKQEGSTAVVRQGYGLTEMGSVCVLNHHEVKAGSIGQPLDKVEVLVVDENLKEVKRGEVGEVLFHSDQMMNGYLADEETTAASFAEIDGVKWLRTGDIMSLDEDNFLFFKGRKKRLIKISGMNVFPLHIEELAKELSEVVNCVATQKNVEGKPFVCLVLVLKEGVKLDDALKLKITAHLCKNLSHWSVPKYFMQVDALPYTGFGKVDFKAVGRLCNEETPTP